MDHKRRVLFQKLYYLIHRSWVDARNLSYAKRSDCVADLSDTFEIVPSLMAHREDGHLTLIRDNLARYQERNADLGHDYLSLLDMDDEEFMAIYESW